MNSNRNFIQTNFYYNFWIVHIQALTISIQFLNTSQFIFTLITSLHITHTRILSSTAFQSDSSIRVICKNILKRSKIEKEIFLQYKIKCGFWKYYLPQLFGLFVIIYIWIHHTRTCDIHSVSLYMPQGRAHRYMYIHLI